MASLFYELKILSGSAKLFALSYMFTIFNQYEYDMSYQFID